MQKLKNEMRCRYWLFGVLLAILMAIALWVINGSEIEHIIMYESQQIKGVDALYSVSKNNKGNVTKSFYTQFVLGGASVSDVSTIALIEETCEDASRTEDIVSLLELRYDELFSSLESAGVSRINIYKNTGESLLEIHRPGMISTSGSEPPRMVEDVIESQKSISGVDVRSGICECHYVYPLISDGVCVGAIEFSYDLDNTINPVKETYGLDSLVLHKGDMPKLVETLDEGQLEEDYSKVDKFSSIFGLESIGVRLLNETIISEMSTYETSLESSVFSKELNGKYILVIAKPILNAYGESVATVFFYKEDYLLTYLEQHKTVVVRVVGVLIGLVFLTIVLVLYLLQKFHVQANRDALTNLYNRNYSFEHLEGVINDGVVFLIDIDDFKKVNDTYGHLKGDYVLSELAKVLNWHIRNEDFAVRWGGEEFVIIIKNVDIASAEAKANQLCEIVSQHDFEGINITVSIGISPILTKLSDAINTADEALYTAKANGKNQAVIH